MNYTNQIEATRSEALSYIKSILDKRGSNYELIEPASYDDDDTDESVYDLPTAYYIDKHNFYTEYPIVIINIENDILNFVGLGCKNDNEDYTFVEQELSTNVICAIADLVYQLEN